MASKLPKDDFNIAVAKIAQGIHNGIQIETDAKHFLSVHLRSLTTSISNKAAERCVQNGEKILKYTDIIRVLHAFIAEDVLKFAHAEACRNMLLHSSGIKVFKPKKLRTAGSDVAAVKDRIIAPIFEKAIRTVKAHALQLSTLPKFDEGLQLINVIITNIGNLLLVELCKFIKDKSLLEIDDSHVRECMEKSLPPILLQHCNYAGITLVEKYQKGELKFDTYLDISKTADRRTTKSKPKKTTKGKIIQEKSVKKRHAIKRPGKKISKKPAVKRKRSTPKRSKKSSKAKSSKKSTKRARQTKPVKKAVKKKQKRKPDKEMSERESVKKAKKSVKQELDISNGILQILEMHQWQCEKDAIEKLNSYLMDVLAEFIEECTVESGVTIAKIQAAAKRWLPPRLACHAIAHAAKSLLLAS